MSLGDSPSGYSNRLKLQNVRAELKLTTMASSVNRCVADRFGKELLGIQMCLWKYRQKLRSEDKEDKATSEISRWSRSRLSKIAVARPRRKENEGKKNDN